jgi:RNA polymerase sigma-70 factor (ECF subfamily)
VTRAEEFQERDELADRFFRAREGDVDGLREVLAADVHLIGDSGDEAPRWPQGVLGVENVVRVLAANIPALVHIGVTVERRVWGRFGAQPVVSTERNAPGCRHGRLRCRTRVR